MPELNNPIILLIIAALSFSLAGCSTQMASMDTNRETEISSGWNDTDSHQVSAEMVQDVLNNPWLVNFTQEHKRRPIVTVGEVLNLSGERINIYAFVVDIQRALSNSDRVQFIFPVGALQKSGADFILKGTIKTIIDTSRSTQPRYYQVNLVLISLEDEHTVWIGEQIRKIRERSSPDS